MDHTTIEQALELTEEIANSAHRVYLNNEETKTRFAEHDTKWNADIQHRNHEAMETVSSDVEILALMLQTALAEIKTLKEQIQQNQK